MKNPFARLTAAATIVLVALLSITLLNQTAAPAWAIDQTIEALSNIRFIHLAGSANYPGQPQQKFEIWAAPNSADPSISGDFRLTEGDSHIAVVSEADNTTWVYSSMAGGDVVYITEGLNRSCNPLPTGDLFRQFKETARNWSQTYAKDDSTGADCVFVTFQGPAVNTASYWKLQFDLQSKLPIRAGVWSQPDYSGTPHFDYTTIEYVDQCPQGAFDFDIPAGAQVVDCTELRNLLDAGDDAGVLVAQADTSQACVHVAEQYFQAVIDADWDAVTGLRPLATGDALERLQTLYAEHQPAELLGVDRMNHLDDPGTFAEAACTLRMKDGTIRQCVLNIEIRQCPRGRIGAVAGSIFGELTQVR